MKEQLPIRVSNTDQEQSSFSASEWQKILKNLRETWRCRRDYTDRSKKPHQTSTGVTRR